MRAAADAVVHVGIHTRARASGYAHEVGALVTITANHCPVSRENKSRMKRRKKKEDGGEVGGLGEEEEERKRY